jgi:serine/threonine protein kinase
MMKYYKYTLEKYLQIKWKDIQDNPKLGMSIFIQILKGLVELKISHRDIKPSNILINEL